MHVMVANNIYPPIAAGGAELIVSYLCEGLVKRGHRVTVVSTCGPDMEPYPVETRNGVEVIRFFPANLYWFFERDRRPGLKKWAWHARDAWNRDAGRRLATIIDETRPDLLHTHVIDGMSASIWGSARQRAIPVLHTAHDYHLICPRAFMLTSDWQICRQPSAVCRVYRSWHLHTAGDVDLFVSPSQFLLDQHKTAGLRAARTAVVHNGIPLPPDQSHRKMSGRTTFVLLARLTVEKGVRVVLEAVAALPRTLDFELVIAGRGPLEGEMRQAAAADSRIRFLGYVSGEAKQALLRSADYLLIPSLWYENAPVAVIEAAAYRIGVIASRIGGLPEFVREGQTGLLFEPGDAAGLASLMQDLLNGTVTLPNLVTACRSLAEQHTVDRMVDQYLEQYRELQALRRRPIHQRKSGNLEIRSAA